MFPPLLLLGYLSDVFFLGRNEEWMRKKMCSSFIKGSGGWWSRHQPRVYNTRDNLVTSCILG